MAILLVTLTVGMTAGLSVLTWVLWKNLWKHEKLALRVLTGVVMAITGLGALLSGMCGVLMTGGI